MSDANENLPELDDQDDVVASDADDAHETAPRTETPGAAPTAPVAPVYAAVPSAQQPKRQRGFIAGVAVVALACGVIGGVGSSAVFNSATRDPAAVSTQSGTSTGSDAGIKTTTVTSSSDLTKVINAKLPSIVTIGVTGSQESGTGSGVVLNSDGYIVTNAHVATLEGTTARGSITVRTSSGDTYKATLVGYDATADVAVVKVAANAKGITPITFADSDKVQVGDTTIAIGSPLGLSGTVTNGIVSALNRPILVQSAAVNQAQGAQNNSTVALLTIQTNAAINQGNSGGALLDGNGNLIGLNDAIATGTTTGGSGTTGSIGIGFAIPGDYVKRIAESIINKSGSQHGYLGVGLVDYQPGGASFATGARVQTVSSTGPAGKAGLREDDVIIKINDTVVEGSTQATALVKQLMPGSVATLTVTRDGTDRAVKVTLGTTKDQ